MSDIFTLQTFTNFLVNSKRIIPINSVFAISYSSCEGIVFQQTSTWYYGWGSKKEETTGGWKGGGGDRWKSSRSSQVIKLQN